MRCNFVDLYHALYGIKRPLILCAPETSAMTSGLPRIPKLSDKHRSVSPCETKPLEINTIESNSREASQLYKREPELNIEDDQYSIKEEQPEVIKVSFFIGSFIVHALEIKYFLILSCDYHLKDDNKTTSNVEAAIRPPDAKKMKTEFCSDNSVSLPGITGSSGPVGFEPGMFKNEDENSSCSHTKSKSDKDKSIDGQSKVSVHFLRNSELHLTCLTPFYFRKRRRKTKNATSTRSIVIIKTRRSAKRVANVKRAENVRRARRRKIRTYHVCR